jgi:hypothetical protein
VAGEADQGDQPSASPNELNQVLVSAFGGATDTADLMPKNRHFFKTLRVKTTP